MEFRLTLYFLFVAAWFIVKIRSLIGQKKRKVAVVYGGILLLSYVVGSLLIARVNVPSPVVPFQRLFEPIGRMLIR